jgi:ferric-dicitrate binding protein FerR (iron transport regulator)/tetratricopeptide (TPR) repeat protein
MSTPHPQDDGRRPDDVAEQNIHRLLGQAYRPEAADPAFVRRLTDRLCATAREAARARYVVRTADALRASRRQRYGALAAAAAVAFLAVGLYALEEPGPSPLAPLAKTMRDGPTAATPARQGDLSVMARASKKKQDHAKAALAPPVESKPNSILALEEDRLTPQPLPPAPPPDLVAVGTTVQTADRERRRVAMGDGSVLSLNQDTAVAVTSERHITLRRGEVFVEVSPRPADAAGATFVVKTADREVAALGTKFDVRAGGGTGVVVTQGKVRVSGLNGVVRSGQELEPGRVAPAPAPRASYVLDWARDLMAAAESPLVPRSAYAGGALVAFAPDGEQARISLRKYHIDVHVEDGFARTTIDQTYFNNEDTRLEGTFYFPLPADASLSRLAMYVDGHLMEGGMAERDRARQVFEDIVRRMKDPALLEWVDGTTFRMRVFPLEPRQEKRLILSYTQHLPSLYGKTTYRFPAGHSLGAVRDWSFHARVKNGAALAWSSPTHALTATREGNDLLLDRALRNVKPDRDVVLDLVDRTVKTSTAARFSSAESEGSRYLMLRWRPALPGEPRRQRRDWVFLFESSADRDPLLARVQVEVVRNLLENAEHDDTFVVLTAGSRVHAFAEKPLPATPENVKKAVAFLERAHLVGALDLGQALAAAGKYLKAGENPYLVHLGGGIPAVGERSADVLARRLPEGTRYVGVAVGKRWDRGFMKAAADRSRGYVTQINPDEPVSWRAFELFGALNAPRLLNVQVVDNTEKVRFLTCAGSLAQGEELCAAACTGSVRDPLPESLTVSGTLDGKPYHQVVPVRDVADHADYLPRTWAKLEIDRLLAEDATANRNRIVALSKSMYVMTPFTSLLVLEDRQMYAQYGVDTGRNDHWAMYPCPETIPVVRERLAGKPAAPPVQAAAAVRPSVEQVLESILVHVPPQALRWPGQGDATGGRRAVTAYEVYRGTFALPPAETWSGPIRDDRSPRKAEGDKAAPEAVPQTFGRALPPPPPAPTPATPRVPTIRAPFEHPPAAAKPVPPPEAPAKGAASAGARAPAARYSSMPMRPEAAKTSAEKKDSHAPLAPAPAEVPGGAPVAPAVAPAGPAGTLRNPPFKDVQIKRAAPASGGGGSAAHGPGTATPPGMNTPALTASPVPVLSAVGQAGRSPSAGMGGTVPLGRNGYPNANGAAGGMMGMAGGMAGGMGMMGGGGMGYGAGAPGGFGGSGLGRMPAGGFQPDFAYRTGLSAGYFNQPFGMASNLSFSSVAGPRGPVSAGDRSELGDAILRAKTPVDVLEREARMRRSLGVDGKLMEQAVRALQDQGNAADERTRLLTDFFPDAERFERQRNAGMGQQLEGLHGEERKPAADALALRIGRPLAKGSLAPPLYERPSYSRDERLFWDLPSYAPGLNTSRADVEAVLEAEAAGAEPTLGTIDPAARRLIDAARAAGWSRVAPADRPDLALVCDGAGRYAWEHTLPAGLVEHVVCDGRTLLHLYPELGLGARRTVSRFHRADLQTLVPWAVPPAEDLAHDADVRRVDAHTVAVVPHGPAREELRLDFAADGRLAERRHVALPKGTVLARETYAADGTVRTFDATGQEVVRRFVVTPAPAPDLAPDTRQLVVLPLPLRTRDHVLATRTGPWDGNFATLDGGLALAMLAADATAGGDDARRIIEQRFLQQGDHRPGFSTLWVASGAGFDQVPMPDLKTAPTLALYLFWLKQRDGVAPAAPSDGLGDGLLGRLAAFHNLAQPWQRGDSVLQGGESTRLLDHVRAGRSPVLTWALASLVLEDTARHTVLPGGMAKVKEGVLAAAVEALAKVPVLEYVARYEQARLCWQGGERDRARALFRAAYRAGERDGLLPPIDADFRNALRPSGEWARLFRDSAGRLLAEKHDLAVLALARQAALLDDQHLADELSAEVVGRVRANPRPLPVSVAVVVYLRQTHQYQRAGEVLDALLADARFARNAGLWRLAAGLAAERHQADRERDCLEKALALEYPHLPEEIDVGEVRRDYGTLLTGYERLADALATLHEKPPADLAGRVVSAADRWRSLDADSTPACLAAARILKALGKDDLAWDYLTTPFAGRPGDAAAPLELARTLAREGSADLADRAYRLAAEADPSNAGVLWERVQSLEQAGRTAEARRVLRRIADGTWPEPYRELQRQARSRLGGPAVPVK